MKHFLSTIGIAILLLSAAIHGDAATITIGNTNGSNAFPFGTNTDGSAAYSGEYQQIYSSTSFSGPISISQLAFSSDSKDPASITYSFTLALGVTTRTPSSPGSTYSGTFTPVFSGALTASLTSTPSDFDLVITLTSPFIYNPALGNLLLDLNVTSAAGPNALFFSTESSSSSFGRVFNASGTGASTEGPNRGLVTRVTGTTVPEPSAFVLIAFALVWLGYFRIRRTGPNHALQRTAPRVTVAAFHVCSRLVRSWRCLTSVASFFAPPSQLPRHAPLSLSFGSLAVARASP